MATSYPDKTNARGIWRITDITRNIKTEGTFPGSSGSIGIYAGGVTPSTSNIVQSVNQTSTGDTTDFGDLQTASGERTSAANGTRAVFAGDSTGTDTFFFSTKGNGSDFVTLGIDPRQLGSCGNKTRGLFHGNGAPAFVDTVEYIEFATLGFKADFGDLTGGKDREGACSSLTRGIWAGGENPDGNVNVIEFAEIATTGDAIDFGDLTEARRYPAGASSSTRGLFVAGYTDGITDDIDSVQIASHGNGTDYGDLSTTRFNLGTLSNSVRGIYAGGSTGSLVNTMDFSQFASSGAVTDFGDLTTAATSVSGASPTHGGIDQNFPRAPELYSPTGRPLVYGDEAGLGDIGLFQSGGYGYVYTIDYIKISSASNGTDFGDTATKGTHMGGAGSATRAFIAGYSGPIADNIDYGTFSTKGNHSDFGNLTDARDKVGSFSNNTRAVWFGGRIDDSDNLTNIIDYITMATIGNASDFGDLAAATHVGQGVASNTRGVSGGGKTPSYIDVIQYVTIGSTGNASDFGDLTVARGPGGGTGASSQTRGIFAGGEAPSNSDVMDYITIASTGDATDFGDLAFVTGFASGLSNNVRAVFSGFNNTGAPGADGTFGQTPHISYVTIASTGDITNFGDLTERRYGLGAASNGHGGLS